MKLLRVLVLVHPDLIPPDLTRDSASSKSMNGKQSMTSSPRCAPPGTRSVRSVCMMSSSRFSR